MIDDSKATPKGGARKSLDEVVAGSQVDDLCFIPVVWFRKH